MLLAYLPAMLVEAYLEMLNEPARGADTSSEHERSEGGQPHTNHVSSRPASAWPYG